MDSRLRLQKNDKVKAIVVRKKANAAGKEIKTSKSNAINLQRSSSHPVAYSNSIAESTETESEPGRFVLRRPDDNSGDDDDGDKKQGKTEEIHKESNLTLNISKGILADIEKIKKQKLMKDERRNLKRNEHEKRFKRQTADKVLTPAELKEGLQKFSDIPVKKKATNEKKMQATVKSVNLFTDNPETKILGQRLVKPVTEKLFTGDSIKSLDLHPHCVKNLSDLLGITELTTVQKMTIPKALEGRDCLVRSQTGSGKTLAYALPIVQKLQEIRPKLTRDCGVQAVIIVPTRELVIQTYELFVKLLKPFTWLVPGMLTGGEKRKAEKARLRKGITVLIGTPGRLCDHLLHTESFKLDKVKFLVLDEADRLLELGYERDVKRIVEGIDEHKAGRFTISTENSKLETITSTADHQNTNSLKQSVDLQRLLLSATLTSAVQKLAGLTLKNPLFIDTSDADPVGKVNIEEKNYENAIAKAVDEGKLVIPETVSLNYIVVPPKLRLVTLSGLLAKECKNKTLKILIFMSTMEMVNFHHDLLNEGLTNKVLDEDDEPNDSEEDEEALLQGIKFFRLHGSMTQQERSGVFKAFRGIKAGVLLATDVAGRGIDVPEVDLVIQYSPPQKIPEFVHRVGRTGRAGRNGCAILFLSPNETQFIRMLEDKRIRISQENMETYLDSLHAADSSANTSQEAASNLQHKLEELILEDKEMHDKACKAFISWVRFYSAFPKDLKAIFNIKTAHMGHFAKSFGLREQPKSFAKKHTAPKSAPPTNRLTYTDRNLERTKSTQNQTTTKQQQSGHNGSSNYDSNKLPSNKFKRLASQSITLSTSEFDSGLPAIKRKRK